MSRAVMICLVFCTEENNMKELLMKKAVRDLHKSYWTFAMLTELFDKDKAEIMVLHGHSSCQQCGKVFIKKIAQQRYCGECGEKRRKAARLRANATYSEKHGTTK